MTTPFLSLASLGKNHWWRYLASVFIIFIFWQILGGIPLGIMVVMLLGDENPATDVNLETLEFTGIDPLWPYLAINFTLLGMLAGLLLSVRFLHQRSILSLVTPLTNLNWQLLLKGFTVYFLLTALATFAESLFRPVEYEMTFDFEQFIIFLPLALIITPLQAAAEELLFRGYLMQGISMLTRIIAVPVIGSSLVFMLAHFSNPEMQADETALLPLLYFLLALFLAIITVKSNSLELAIGVHAANNLFAVLVMNYANSALPAPSIFTASEIDPLASLISFVLIAAAFYAIVFARQPQEV
ncbi:MAG TPA: CPBP family intramembrane metalloprotease [Candidatus Thiothrix moscowensis]|uniref:CPBP family intramembrane glutamic endopeptidase n=1 Tax=unclassified Thiothrix TaxID=2636184 RepID=UPI0025E0866A|nr:MULTISPECIES: CPBP family intramembrane glutamic endopeptidase [unclassified Thiothrix]HRJ54208.1 CPBP family intramembrane metalloprotease [Candidatus Thiothrix moscowensis]HRJ94474.1 CPBP family intramembrane metalloprotease [Candidatus Thiothrix moscowensis]